MRASTPPPSPRAVVDTNLFVSGLILRTASAPAQLIDAIIAQRFTLVTSAPLDAEVTEVLARPGITERYAIDPAIKRAVLDRLTTAEHVVPLPALPVPVRDPKDEKVLACALAAGADFVVTGDADLLTLNGNPALGDVRIVTVGNSSPPLQARDRPSRVLKSWMISRAA